MKKLLCISLLITQVLSAQTTQIPDPNFEQALIDLGHDTVLDGQVRTDSISNIVEIDLSERNISNLTGIEGFTNIEVLRCGRNSLTQLNLSQNLKLTFLSGFLNQLVQVNLSQNHVLEVVQLSSNQINELNVASNTKLKILAVNDNQIDTIDISQNLDMFRLAMEDNNLTEIDVSNNLLLEELYIRGNELTTLDVSQNRELTSLDCSVNLLTALDVTSCPYLDTLKFDRNAIGAIDLRQNTLLDLLLCYENQLTELDLSQNTLITYVSASSNQLTALNVSQNPLLRFFFVHENNLTTLDLSNNPELFRMTCNNNDLSNLNMKNGNNPNIELFYAYNNQNLQCIEVDDIFYSNVNWNQVDSGVVFSTSCNPLSNDEFSLNESLSLYPNPVEDQLILRNNNRIAIKSISVYNFSGRLIQKNTLNNSLQETQIDLTQLSAGVYLLEVYSDRGKRIQKLIKR